MQRVCGCKGGGHPQLALTGPAHRCLFLLHRSCPPTPSSSPRTPSRRRAPTAVSRGRRSAAGRAATRCSCHRQQAACSAHALRLPAFLLPRLLAEVLVLAYLEKEGSPEFKTFETVANALRNGAGLLASPVPGAVLLAGPRCLRPERGSACVRPRAGLPPPALALHPLSNMRFRHGLCVCDRPQAGGGVHQGLQVALCPHEQGAQSERAGGVQCSGPLPAPWLCTGLASARLTPPMLLLLHPCRRARRSSRGTRASSSPRCCRPGPPPSPSPWSSSSGEGRESKHCCEGGAACLLACCPERLRWRFVPACVSLHLTTSPPPCLPPPSSPPHSAATRPP